MNYAIIDVDVLHAVKLYTHICKPVGFDPDIFIIDNSAKSIIEYINAMIDTVIALPIAFRHSVEFQTSCLLIIHQDANIVNKNSIRVNEKPASSAVVRYLLDYWRLHNENQRC